MGRLIITLLLCIPLTTLAASEGRVVNEWWQNTYQQQIVPQQKQKRQQRTATRCEKKVAKYAKRVVKYPNSSYYKYKLKSWRKRCDEEAKEGNPYIKK